MNAEQIANAEVGDQEIHPGFLITGGAWRLKDKAEMKRRFTEATVGTTKSSFSAS